MPLLYLSNAIGDVQELVGEQLGKRQKNAGTQDFRVNAGDAVDVRGADDGEVGHAHLVLEMGGGEGEGVRGRMMTAMKAAEMLACFSKPSSIMLTEFKMRKSISSPSIWFT